MVIDSALKEFVCKVYPLNDEDVLALQQCFKRVMVEKKDFILKEGQQTQTLFFIRSGIFRGYYLKDIEEFTLNFYFGPTFYADIVSIHDQTPTRYNVQCMDAGEVWIANIREIEMLGQQFPGLLTLFIRFYEVIYSFGHKRQLSFIYESAEERYLNLFQQRPKVLEKIPLIYIASYLGMKPESLSRIRKKISH